MLIIGAVLLGCIWAAEDQSHASSAAASNALPDANAAAPDANAATDANATSN